MVNRGLNLLIAAAVMIARLMGPAIVTTAPAPPGAGPAAVQLRQTTLNVKTHN